MRNRSRLTLGALLVIAAAASSFYFYFSLSAPSSPPTTGDRPSPNQTRGQSAESDSQHASTDSAKPTAHPAPSTVAASSVRTKQLGSLPPLNKPLAPQIQTLEDRAKSGDTESAIALWYGLEQCAGITNGAAEADLNLMKKGYDNDKNARPPDYTGRIRDLLTNCADVTGPQMAKRFDWLRAAAEQGDPQAQYLYAHAGTEAVGGDMEALRDPQKWAEYRDTANSYIEGLAKQCSGDAIADLAHSYTFGTAYYSPDIIKAYVFRALSVRLSNLPENSAKQYLEQLSPKMSADQVNQAAQLAGQFYGQYCN